MRTLHRILPVVMLLAASGMLNAQDRAKPREKERKEPPPRSQPAPHRAEPAPAPEPAPPPQTESQRRRPRPDGQAVPRRQPPSPQADARSRHPRPDPSHAYRERQFRWRPYQHEWWYGPGFYFDFRFYDGPRWRMRYRSFFLYPHARLPYDYGWFYWPFWDEPDRGCGWYWVPTRRELYYDEDGYPYWRYRRWRRLYVCFD